MANQRIRMLSAALTLMACAKGDSPDPTAPGGPGGTPAPEQVGIAVDLQVLQSTGSVPIVGAPFARQLSAHGGTPPYTWSVSSGALPPGLTLSASGLLSGTVRDAGAYAYGLRLTDAKGASVVSSITGSVATSGSYVFEIGTAPILVFGLTQEYAFQPFIQGGTLPYHVSIENLPSGLSYDPATGFIRGRPNAAGTYEIRIRVTDGAGNATAPVTVTAMAVASQNRPTGSGAAKYFGTWIGQFNVQAHYCEAGWNILSNGTGCQRTSPQGQSETVPRTKGSASFRVTLTVDQGAIVNGLATLLINHVTISDGAFGCQSGCSISQGVSGAATMLLDDPPRNISSSPGIGVAILKSPMLILTDNEAGSMHASSTGILISNSLDPSITKTAWSAAGADGKSFEEHAFPQATTGFEVIRKSWALIKSGL